MAERLLYLADAAVERHLPSPADAVRLADGALRAIADGEAILRHDAIRPVPGVGFSAIYGAYRRGGNWLAGQKWVAESRDGVAATLLMNDGEAGTLHTIMNARNLTGLRTAAVSGACVSALGGDGPVALVGTGLQAKWHLRVLDALGRRDIRLAYRRRSSGEAILAFAAEELPKVRVTLAQSVRDAIAGAAVAITMVTRGATDAIIPTEWLDEEALVLPVDFAHCISADTARAAAALAADDIANYDHARETDELPGYPPARCATGELLARRRPSGRILIQNLGNAAADLAIAAEVREAAIAGGAGTWLER